MVALPPRLPALLVSLLLAALAFIAGSSLLTTCDTRRPEELSRRAEKRVLARHDTAVARAARAHDHSLRQEAQAQAYYAVAQQYQDSATYYVQHEDVIRVPASDTARVQRLFTELFD